MFLHIIFFTWGHTYLAQTVWLPRLMALVRLIYLGFLEKIGPPIFIYLYIFAYVSSFFGSKIDRVMGGGRLRRPWTLAIKQSENNFMWSCHMLHKDLPSKDPPTVFVYVAMLEGAVLSTNDLSNLRVWFVIARKLAIDWKANNAALSTCVHVYVYTKSCSDAMRTKMIYIYIYITHIDVNIDINLNLNVNIYDIQYIR